MERSGMRGPRSRITLALHPGYGAIIFSLLVALCLLAPPAVAQRAAPPADIAVTAKTIDAFHLSEPSTMRFGALEFRGGLELTANHRDFGGVSAIRVAADGAKFVALTDK